MQAVICQNLPYSLVSKTVIFYLIRRLTESGCALVLQECLLLWQAPSPSHACGGGRSRQVVKTTISGLWWVPSWVGKGCPSDMFKLQPWKGLHYIFSVLKAFSFIWIKIESTTAQVCLGADLWGLRGWDPSCCSPLLTENQLSLGMLLASCS